MANSTWTEATAGALAGLLYGVILWLLAVGVIGGGHGTVIPWFLSLGHSSFSSLERSRPMALHSFGWRMAI
jgi:hypothetical protein